MFHTILKDALKDMALIRTTFETLDLFPAGDPIRADIEGINRDARDTLISRFNDLCDGIQENRTDYKLHYEAFKAGALQMMTRGYPDLNLNSWMKTTAFGDSGTLYYLKVTGLEDIEIARRTPAQAFAVLLFRDVLERIQVTTNYSDKETFDRNVFQKYCVVLFLCYSTDNPMFYGLN